MASRLNAYWPRRWFGWCCVAHVTNVPRKTRHAAHVLKERAMELAPRGLKDTVKKRIGRA